MSTHKLVDSKPEYRDFAVQSSAEARDFSLFQIVHTGSGAHTSYYSLGTQISFPRHTTVGTRM